MLNAVVTGGSSGIGKAIKLWLQERDYNVLNISKETGRDISGWTNQSNIIEEIEDKFNTGLDLLVNNAGYIILEENGMEPMDVRNLIDVNLIAPYEFSWHLFSLLEQRRGSIINIASVSGMKADPDTPMYGATKAGIISITKSFALGFAPFVRVNCISPGFVNTNFVQEDLPNDLLKLIPLGYEAHAENLLTAVEFLINSRYTTGANIVVDGGLSL